MNMRSIVGALVAVLMLCGVATAQQIVEKSNPALGGWQVSISQKFAPGVFKHSATFKTLAEARADAKRRIAQNPSKGNEWDLHTVLIEGGDPKPKKAEPEKKAQPEKKDGEKKDGDLLKTLGDAKDAADRAVQTGKADLAQAIQDYKQAIEDTYRRIKDFEKDLVAGTQELQEKRFREANALVDRYNRQVANFQSVMGPSVPLGYKPLPRFEVPPPADEKQATPAADFKLYTIQNAGAGGQWQSAATHESLEAAKAAGERYLFASRDQRCYAVVNLRDARKQIGDRPTHGDLYETAVVMRCKPWGGSVSLESSTARNPNPR